MRQLVFFILVVTVLGVGTLRAQSLSARLVLEPAFTLGSGSDDPNLMFGDPAFVRSDGAGNIYVFDQLSMRVKIYDRQGQFVRTLGKRGRGQGHYNNFSTAHVTPDGEVLVFDQLNSRLTRITPDGKVDVQSLDPSRILWPRDVIRHRSHYLLPYRLKGSPMLIHEWDSTFSTPLRRFGRVTSLPRGDHGFVEAFTLVAGVQAEVWHDHLVISSPVCSGELLQYDLATDMPLAERLSGVPLTNPSFTTVTVEEAEAKREAVLIRSSGESFAAEIGCRSVGFVPLQGGLLAHFSVRREDSDKVLFVELFDEDGTLVGGHVLGQFTSQRDRSSYTPLKVFGGTANRLFVVDRRGEEPLVQVFDVLLQRP